MSEKIDPKTPILVGCGQFTDKAAPQDALDPMQFLNKVATLAGEDTTKADAVWKELDTVSIIEFTVDSPGNQSPMRKTYKNPPRSVAQGLGRESVKTEIYAATGGNSPQMLVNDLAERISKGDSRVGLIAGCEVLNTMIGGLKAGVDLSTWNDDPGGEPIIVGTNKSGSSDHEKKHGIYLPVNIYPMFENSIRGKLGHSIEQHMKHMGELNSRFTKVAAQNPLAWFPVERSAEELTTVTDDNRWVGFPYPKYLNSIIRVNQGGAVVMTSVEAAEQLGIPRDKWVFLHGCGDAYDKWFVTDRENYHSSRAIRMITQKAFDMAGWSVDDLDYMDLYSCFPSAVQIACMELGIPFDDPRGLTVTGGLPYFGGPGSAYVLHSIATMMEKVRAKPGSKGLVTANGWYVTKHACGLYSTEPKQGGFDRGDDAAIQEAINNAPSPEVVETPQGEATIETYTVVHGRDKPTMGLVIGRLPDGRRFVANTPNDEATLIDLRDNDSLGRKGTVTQNEDGVNIFTPAT